jgi:uncharacterized protein
MWTNSVGCACYSRFFSSVLARILGLALTQLALVSLALAAAASTDSAPREPDPPGAATAAAPRPPNARRIDWDVLLPARERAHYNEEPPPPIHDYLGEGGKAARQSGSIAVNARLDQTWVKIAGFVVPLVQDDSGLVTVFFLVPYLGACIHVPPPPPNQIVYVKLSGGGGVRMGMGALEEPYWITGQLHTQTSDTRLATAAYTLDATRMERYKY